MIVLLERVHSRTDWRFDRSNESATYHPHKDSLASSQSVHPGSLVVVGKRYSPVMTPLSTAHRHLVSRLPGNISTLEPEEEQLLSE